MSLHIESWKVTGEAYEVTITEQMIQERAGTPTVQVIEQLNALLGWEIDPYEFRVKKNEVYLDIKSQNGKIQPIESVTSCSGQNGF